MASRGGYRSLPADLDESSAPSIPEEQHPLGDGSGGAASSNSSPDNTKRSSDADGPSSFPPANAAGGKKGANKTSTTSAHAASNEKASPLSGADKKTDPTGGLPTAEGVFVGDPVSQSTAYPTAAVSGNYDHHRHTAGTSPAAHATVITSAPQPTYSNHVATGIAAAAAMGGSGTAIAIPQGGAGGGGSGQHTVIVMNNAPGHQFGEWGRQPQLFVCRACGYSGLSAAVTVRERERERQAGR